MYSLKSTRRRLHDDQISFIPMVDELESSSTPLSTVEEMMLPKTEEVWKKRKKTPKKRTITWSVLAVSSLSLLISAYLKRIKPHLRNIPIIRARLRDSPNL